VPKKFFFGRVEINKMKSRMTAEKWHRTSVCEEQMSLWLSVCHQNIVTEFKLATQFE